MWSLHPDMSPMKLVKQYVANMLLCILKKAKSLCTFGVLSALQLFNVSQLQKFAKDLHELATLAQHFALAKLEHLKSRTRQHFKLLGIFFVASANPHEDSHKLRGHEALVGCRRYSLLFFHLVPATWEGISPKTSWDQL